MYLIRVRESGDIFDSFNNLDVAIKELKKYETDDKNDGIFEEDFYEIYDSEKEEIIW